MKTQVLVIGEALIDIVDGPGGVTEFVGGSPANVAVGLARQGLRTQLYTRIGTDQRGIRIAEQVAASGVGIASSSWTGAPTSTARARLQPDGSAAYDFDLDWAIEAPECDADAVHSGSIALFLDPGGDVALTALEQAAHEGRLVTVDPNIRPALVGDREVALRRFWRAVAAADLLKLSDEDAAWLFPGRIPEEVLPDLAGRGPRIVVMTQGGEGAMAYGPGGLVDVPAWPVHVTDTIGAGDAYMASLIASALDDAELFEHETALERALRRAAVAAGITVSRAGANPPTRAQIDALL